MRNMCVRPWWGIGTDDLLSASMKQTFLTEAKLFPLKIQSQHLREQRILALWDPGASHRCCFEHAEVGWAPHSRTCINLLNQTLWYREYCSLKRYDWWRAEWGSLENRHRSFLRTILIVSVAYKQHYIVNAWISAIYMIWSQVILESSTNGPVKTTCGILDTRKFNFINKYATWCDHFKDRTVKTQRLALR